jgi:hypothetical protein
MRKERRRLGANLCKSDQFVSTLHEVGVVGPPQSFGLFEVVERELQVTHLIVSTSGVVLRPFVLGNEFDSPFGIDTGSEEQRLSEQSGTAIAVGPRILLVECNGTNAVGDRLRQLIELEV